LTLENVSGRGQRIVPLALCRLQDVEGVEDASGSPLRFVADVVNAPDWLWFQAASIDVELPRPWSRARPCGCGSGTVAR
jgi:hypothetical protein